MRPRLITWVGVASAATILCVTVGCAATSSTPEPTATSLPVATCTLPADWATRDYLFVACRNERAEPPGGELSRISGEVVDWVYYEEYAEACKLVPTWQALLEEASTALSECLPPASPIMLVVYDTTTRRLQEDKTAADALAAYCHSGDREALRRFHDAISMAVEYMQREQEALERYEVPSPTPTLTQGESIQDHTFVTCVQSSAHLFDGGLVRVVSDVTDRVLDEGHAAACDLVPAWQASVDNTKAAYEDCPSPSSPAMLAHQENLAGWLRELGMSAEHLATYCESGEQDAIRRSDDAMYRAFIYMDRAEEALDNYEAPSPPPAPSPTSQPASTAAEGLAEDREFLTCFQGDAMPAMEGAGETFEALKNMMGTADLPDYCERTSQWQSEVQNAWEMLWRCPDPSDKQLTDAKESCLDSLAEYAMASHYLLEFCETNARDDLDLATWSFENAGRFASECMDALERYEQ